MIRGPALAILVAVAAAAPAAAASPPLAAVVPDPRDARAAVLVGPGGQVYRPDGAGGWARTAGGGVADGVIAAARDGDDLIAAAAHTPLYRWHDGAWHAEPVGVRGAVVLGAGPTPAVAVGAHVLVLDGGAWRRVGDAPRPPTSVWARTAQHVWIVVDGAPWTLRAGRFARAGAAATAVVGARPWALAGRAASLASGGARVTATGPGAIVAVATTPAVATSPSATWLLVRDHATAIERHGKAAAAAPAVPAPGAWAWLWTDPAGRVAVASPTGAIQLLDGGAWRAGTVDDRLAPARPGPGPARSAGRPAARQIDRSSPATLP